MRLLLLFLVTLLGAAATAQPRYRCRYSDTLLLEKTPELLRSIREAEGMEGLPPAVREQLANKLLDELRLRVFLVAAEVFADSTLLTVEDASENERLRTNVSNGRQVVRGGRLWNAEKGTRVDSSNYNIDPARLRATGRTKVLLGHSCHEYADATGNTILWLAPSLPPGITPGVPATPARGAVMELFVRTGRSTSHTIITDIRKL